MDKNWNLLSYKGCNKIKDTKYLSHDLYSCRYVYSKNDLL